MWIVCIWEGYTYTCLGPPRVPWVFKEYDRTTVSSPKGRGEFPTIPLDEKKVRLNLLYESQVIYLNKRLYIFRTKIGGKSVSLVFENTRLIGLY